MIEHVSFDPRLKQSSDIQLLRETVSRFQRLFSASDYGFWEWNLRTNVIEWAGGFWVRLGYDDKDASVINSPEAVLERVYPSDRALVMETFTAHFEVGAPISASYRIYDKKGSLVWIQIRGESCRDDDGRLWMVSGMCFDITDFKMIERALRESETRQARIVQASSDGIWEWYADHGGFHFSQRCWEILGYSAQDDALTQGEDRLKVWRKHIFPEDQQKFDDALVRHIKGADMFDVEYRIICRDGEIRWVRARGRAIFDGHGKPQMMSGSNIDITDIKRAEERVLFAKEQAEKANQAKSDFLSSMSHELRTPLNAILGYAQLFEMDQNLNSMQMSNLREIRKAGQHLLQLINDVLDLSKIESGSFSIDVGPAMASRVVEECCSLLETQASTFGVKVSNSFGAHRDVFIDVDVKRLKQALLNLISNAIKYNRLGGRVDVGLSVLENDRLRIRVEDTGWGIAAGKREQMFEPFNRLAAEHSSVEGSGVGLVITKRLVEMMSGDIDFASTEGVGTVFWMDFPISHQTVEVKTDVPEEVEAPLDLTLAFSHRIKVLYVEDNPTNMRLMQQIAARFVQFDLEVVDEPFMGVFKARNWQPDLVILDINLPGMDGYEVLSVLKSDRVTRDIPVIALSANAMAHDIAKGNAANFHAYLTKPIQLDQFVTTLNTLFRPL